eukprot:2756498-Alexandrium_andersonii.AAC.1
MPRPWPGSAVVGEVAAPGEPRPPSDRPRKVPRPRPRPRLTSRSLAAASSPVWRSPAKQKR